MTEDLLFQIKISEQKEEVGDKEWYYEEKKMFSIF